MKLFRVTIGNPRKSDVTLSQPGVSQSIIAVFVNRLLKTLDPFLQALLSSFVPIEASQEIKPICLTVFSVMFGQTRPLHASQLRHQRSCYLFGNQGLHGEFIGT